MTGEAKRDHESLAVGVGILGMGVVGSGVARVLIEKSDHLASLVGRPVSIMGILVRDPAKRRSYMSVVCRSRCGAARCFLGCMWVRSPAGRS